MITALLLFALPGAGEAYDQDMSRLSLQCPAPDASDRSAAADALVREEPEEEEDEDDDKEADEDDEDDGNADGYSE